MNLNRDQCQQKIDKERQRLKEIEIKKEILEKLTKKEEIHTHIKIKREMRYPQNKIDN